jgi:hypothetical protein
MDGDRAGEGARSAGRCARHRILERSGLRRHQQSEPLAQRQRQSLIVLADDLSERGDHPLGPTGSPECCSEYRRQESQRMLHRYRGGSPPGPPGRRPSPGHNALTHPAGRGGQLRGSPGRGPRDRPRRAAQLAGRARGSRTRSELAGAGGALTDRAAPPWRPHGWHSGRRPAELSGRLPTPRDWQDVQGERAGTDAAHDHDRVVYLARCRHECWRRGSHGQACIFAQSARHHWPAPK